MVSSLFTIFCKAAVSFAAMGGPDGVALTTGATMECAGECTGVWKAGVLAEVSTMLFLDSLFGIESGTGKKGPDAK